jgi:hypothetical protein
MLSNHPRLQCRICPATYSSDIGTLALAVSIVIGPLFLAQWLAHLHTATLLPKATKETVWVQKFVSCVAFSLHFSPKPSAPLRLCGTPRSLREKNGSRRDAEARSLRYR